MRFSCPDCSSTFQTAAGAAPAAGLRCPACGAAMVATADVVELHADRAATRRYDLDELRARLEAERGLSAQRRTGRVETPERAGQIWFVGVQGRQVGPLSTGGLQGLRARGQLGAASLVWREGWPGWVALEAVAELRGLAGLVEATDPSIAAPFDLPPHEARPPAPPPPPEDHAEEITSPGAPGAGPGGEAGAPQAAAGVAPPPLSERSPAPGEPARGEPAAAPVEGPASAPAAAPQEPPPSPGPPPAPPPLPAPAPAPRADDGPPPFVDITAPSALRERRPPAQQAWFAEPEEPQRSSGRRIGLALLLVVALVALAMLVKSGEGPPRAPRAAGRP